MSTVRKGVMSTETQKYNFECEYFDQQASLVRKYRVSFFPSDNSIEMWDMKNNRVFLKRCVYPTVKLDDLFIGAQVNIYSRPLKVIAFADKSTEEKLAQDKSRTIMFVRPDGYEHIGRVLDTVLSHRNKFVISQLKMVQLSASQAAQYMGDEAISARARALAAGPGVVVEVIGPNVHDVLQELADKAGAAESKRTSSASSEASSAMRFAILSGSQEQAAKDTEVLLSGPNAPGTTATLSDCTLCVIKPHAVTAGQAGKIISAVLDEGFEISAMQLFTLDREAAQEFLEVYKTVVPEYNQMVDQLTTGPCIALEIRAREAVTSFRQVCGPSDPEIARAIRPNTIRAAFGVNKVMNAVHCTDLPEDGTLESEYFFSILQKQPVIPSGKAAAGITAPSKPREGNTSFFW